MKEEPQQHQQHSHIHLYQHKATIRKQLKDKMNLWTPKLLNLLRQKP